MKRDNSYKVRNTLVLNAKNKAAVFRHHNWKLITKKGPGGFTHWEPQENQKDLPEGQLYDLSRDPAEQKNLWDTMPEKVKGLQSMLEAEKFNKKNDLTLK
jgi:hypothetical protein